MKKIFIGLIFLMFAVACTNVNNVEEACVKDAKICPDGSTVGRDQKNNCEFSACPEVEFDRRYVAREPQQCAATTFLCIEGSEQFYDETGCGCQGPAKKYIGDSLEKCSRIKYMCEEGLAPFTDDFGCGCGFDWGLMPEPVPDEKKVTHECKTRSQACTIDYNPVCGWFGQNIQCIKYPCAATYGNACGACADENVEYWTEGECPSDFDNARQNGNCKEIIDACLRNCGANADCSTECNAAYRECINGLDSAI